MLASASARDSEADGADADAGAARCDAGAAQKRRSSIIDEISAIGLGDDDDEDIPIKSPKDMNVRELKAALTEAGVRHDDAIEKFELIEVRAPRARGRPRSHASDSPPRRSTRAAAGGFDCHAGHQHAVVVMYIYYGFNRAGAEEARPQGA